MNTLLLHLLLFVQLGRSQAAVALPEDYDTVSLVDIFTYSFTGSCRSGERPTGTPAQDSGEFDLGAILQSTPKPQCLLQFLTSPHQPTAFSFQPSNECTLFVGDEPYTHGDLLGGDYMTDRRCYLLTPSYEHYTFNGKCAWEEGTNQWQSNELNLANFNNCATSVEECRDYCDQEDLCVSFSYAPYNTFLTYYASPCPDAGNCFLYGEPDLGHQYVGRPNVEAENHFTCFVEKQMTCQNEEKSSEELDSHVTAIECNKYLDYASDCGHHVYGDWNDDSCDESHDVFRICGGGGSGADTDCYEGGIYSLHHCAYEVEKRASDPSNDECHESGIFFTNLGTSSDDVLTQGCVCLKTDVLEATTSSHKNSIFRVSEGLSNPVACNNAVQDVETVFCDHEMKGDACDQASCGSTDLLLNVITAQIIGMNVENFNDCRDAVSHLIDSGDCDASGYFYSNMMEPTTDDNVCVCLRSGANLHSTVFEKSSSSSTAYKFTGTPTQYYTTLPFVPYEFEFVGGSFCRCDGNYVNGYRKLGGVSHDMCRQKCSADAECIGYSTRYDGECYVHTSNLNSIVPAGWDDFEKNGFCVDGTSSASTSTDCYKAVPTLLESGCPQDWERLGNFCYYRSTTNKNYNSARAACENMGATLASITSPEENAFINSLANGLQTWIGLTLVWSSGNHVDSWEDNSPVGYTNWMAGEPNDAENLEDCAHMNHYTTSTEGIWNDAQCSKKIDWVCKKAVDSDCLMNFSTCTAACETAAERSAILVSPQSGNGNACPALTDCQYGEGQCAPPVDCVGSWSSCDSSCLKTFEISTPATGGGLSCDHQHGDTEVCIAGTDACPPDLDCVGVWSLCDSSCQKTFSVIEPVSGNGQCEAFDGQTEVCSPGTDACELDVDCVGTWSSCDSSCQKTFSVIQPQNGNGQQCSSFDGQLETCSEGTDDCPLNVDCVGSWSSCDASCHRTYTVYQFPSGNGASCDGFHEQIDVCAPGQDQCPENDDCFGLWTECTENCQQMFMVAQPAAGNGAPCDYAHLEIAACSPGQGQCPAANVNCQGVWGQCGSDCTKTYTVTQPASGTGAHCPAWNGAIASCLPGEGQCPGVVNNNDCQGAWSQCNAQCMKMFIVTQPAGPGGADCAFSYGAVADCSPGEGQCPIVPGVVNTNDIDCEGQWSDCNSECEKTFTVTQPAGEGGAQCTYPDGATDLCDIGEGECVEATDTDDCVGAWLPCDWACEKHYLVFQPATESGEPCPYEDGALVMCQPGEDMCPDDQPSATAEPTAEGDITSVDIGFIGDLLTFEPTIEGEIISNDIGFIGDLLTDEPTIEGEITIDDWQWWVDGEDIGNGASELPLLLSCIVLAVYML